VFGQEIATSTDFSGPIAATEITGSGKTGTGTTLTYDADMRLMSSKYVAVDGRTREGTFGFV
jgi:hypothetical protein